MRKLFLLCTAVVLSAVLVGAWFATRPAERGAAFTVSLAVRADALLPNMQRLPTAQHELVPPDGAIFPAAQVTAYEGDSVFDLLQREMRRGGIHLASRFTPLAGSAYVQAIHNLYEFDAGPLSGWVYLVNGQSPGVGASQQLLQPGDVVEWHFTLDLGRDVGVDW